MTDDGSAKLVARWRQGDQQAADELFRRYANRLMALARNRLSAKLARRIDAEDVVQSAYRSFFANARDGRYDLEKGGDLWRLLVVMTLHKLNDQVKRDARGKRSIAREQTFASEDSLLGLQPYLTQAPSPEDGVALADTLEQVMRRFGPFPGRVLELRLRGYKLDEIAAQTQRSERTVRRVLEEIKAHLRDWNLGHPEP